MIPTETFCNHGQLCSNPRPTRLDRCQIREDSTIRQWKTKARLVRRGFQILNSGAFSDLFDLGAKPELVEQTEVSELFKEYILTFDLLEVLLGVFEADAKWLSKVHVIAEWGPLFRLLLDLRSG